MIVHHLTWTSTSPKLRKHIEFGQSLYQFISWNVKKEAENKLFVFHIIYVTMMQLYPLLNDINVLCNESSKMSLDFGFYMDSYIYVSLLLLF